MSALPPSSTAASARRSVIGGVAAAAALASAIAIAGPATSATAAKGKPGPVGAAIVLGTHAEFTGQSTDIATDSHGTAYIGWISSPTSNSSDRSVHLCVLPLGARSCTGGVQSINALDASTAEDLHVLAPNHGNVTLLWYHDTVASGSQSHGSQIAEATVSGSKLSKATDVASGPSHGFLLDAAVAPNGSIWTMTYSGVGSIELREGLTHSPSLINVPYGVGFAHLAFSHGTPIVAITQAGQITQPPSYSSRPGSTWTRFKKLNGTWAVGTDIGLVSTRSGVRLITGNGGSNFYQPVVAKWTKHGFSRAKLTGGDHNAPTPTTHDSVTDGSGRLVDAADEGPQIAVANLANTTHAAVVRLAIHGTLAGFAPQVATTARGNGLVLWAVQQGNGTLGDKLSVQPIRLAALRHSKKAHNAHGTVTLTGPVSCMPDSTTKVKVKGKAKHGWHATKPRLTLGHKKLHSTLKGAKLKAGKKYTLRGSVVFANGGSRSKVTAKLKFRACPKP
jgi:hypothetical protein